MGKKRKASGHLSGPKGPKELDPTDARLGPISTYEDVANSEDEFFLNQDKIMLEDGPNSKRRKKDDEDLELSDQEIYGYQDSDSDADDNEDAQDKRRAKKGASGGKQQDVSDDEGGQEDDSGWWGSSKQAYYDADNIETEADALEEEAEAKRLQKKKLSKMREEDFVFDGDEWLNPEEDNEDADDEPVTEVLKDIEITDDMSPDERVKLLATRYPELGYLIEEFQDLHETLAELRAEAKSKPGPTLESVKYWTLGCYVAAMAGYFAILTSPARDGTKTSKPLAPSDLRDHDIMDTLFSCRKAWERIRLVKHLSRGGESSPAPIENGANAEDSTLQAVEKVEKKIKKDKAAAAKELRKQSKAKAIEDDIADLYDLPLSVGKSRRRGEATLAQQEDENSDFGEEDALDERTAADKAARKKSLKFYTSQIVQKASRRAGAGRDAGGDADLPYRERLRDRQARLLAEAEKRGKKGSKFGADLGDDSDDEDGNTASAMREDEDGYYDMVAHSAKNKREDKAARYAAFAAASKADRVVEKEEIGEDGKRKVTYAIEKNKGLAPKRSKDVRNPRVKRRKQYEAKQKKLKSMKPVWQGGEPKGGYQGERTGINTAVVKSIKL
ncbi:hypothetical protein HIM_07785 [Hirsutella minnesotensis 3608]|uniref:Sas10 C-terminal domain-containing protein n=1 Tax=Hirsutella minnesotensis 3608 TaxID=1043627 RepID=A0A0F7ZHL3_9HYPO|nr:hypothetical protein HIM_07785 [Hirsutella minnesotensis 3608]